MSNIESAIYGASASIIANTIVYPLDLVKTVIQTQLELTKDPNDSILKERYKNSLDALIKIYQKRGISGLYRGLSSSLLGTAVQSFTYFYWYSFVRKLWLKFKTLKKLNKLNSTPEELLLGIVAAALGQLFTSPISVISTRQQVSPDKNPTVLETSKNILKEDGITGFWRGLKVSLVLTINPSITYASFERIKTICFPQKSILSPHESFLLGVLSKMLATVITQPLIISKAMLQKNDDKNDENLKNFQNILKYLIKNEGFKSLWKGILPQLTKGVLVQGFIFMFKDQLNVLFKVIFTLIKVRKQSIVLSK
ncbi:hypothetical protein BN7_1845 [Wickerhamomyces ciferrii]|uniref:Peroxisomal adenine nucleotide transporter 1 n=1 Tax=Wickerhamomyces ciferrii (strain ATCC 14091 / BCRC 22168 / CBS 111 / JCM 3599 / NBRC 0793 / NRRL Y-1031 F-60-10) TaxID=1206466 RepID=K0KH48_WICCF|nr:uncharacterized protein BN7_1845 [Wickerhamomyces ciferrii]CCH42301.1 hypothetical protein BN7_1845 [Wickerhamomyces ciferrii]